MRRIRISIGVSAWLSLFILQLSGLHAHANENGFVGAPATGYSHSHSHDHDHEPGPDDSSLRHVHDSDDARDVSFFELASGELKISQIVPARIFLFSFYRDVRTLATTKLSHRLLNNRHTRWRPPLRAPPAHA